jgi:hypothetical protein
MAKHLIQDFGFGPKPSYVDLLRLGIGFGWVIGVPSAQEILKRNSLHDLISGPSDMRFGNYVIDKIRYPKRYK